MKSYIYVIITLLIIFGILFFLSLNSTLSQKLAINCKEGYCQNLSYIKFRDMDEYDTFIIYYSADNGYRAVLNDVYELTSFSLSTDCYMGGCNAGVDNFTNSNHNLGKVLNNNFLNLIPQKYQEYLNFTSWNIKNANEEKTGNAYIGLLSLNDWQELKENTEFKIKEPYWLSNSTDDIPIRIYIVENNNLISAAPNVASAHARPVIELKKNIKITSGDGSYNNPFIIN